MNPASLYCLPTLSLDERGSRRCSNLQGFLVYLAKAVAERIKKSACGQHFHAMAYGVYKLWPLAGLHAIGLNERIPSGLHTTNARCSI